MNSSLSLSVSITTQSYRIGAKKIGFERFVKEKIAISFFMESQMALREFILLPKLWMIPIKDLRKRCF